MPGPIASIIMDMEQVYPGYSDFWRNELKNKLRAFNKDSERLNKQEFREFRLMQFRVHYKTPVLLRNYKTVREAQ